MPSSVSPLRPQRRTYPPRLAAPPCRSPLHSCRRLRNSPGPEGLPIEIDVPRLARRDPLDVPLVGLVELGGEGPALLSATVSQVQEALDKRSARAPEASPPADLRSSPEAQKPAEGAPEKKERVVKMLTFEGEVDPFQFTVLGPAHLVFFRKAWRNNLRYIQGFVVDKAEFMQHVIAVPLGTTTLGQMAWLTAHYQGNLLFSRQPVQRLSDGTETSLPTLQVMRPLYNAPLEAPLDAVALALIGRRDVS